MNYWIFRFYLYPFLKLLQKYKKLTDFQEYFLLSFKHSFLTNFITSDIEIEYRTYKIDPSTNKPEDFYLIEVKKK